MFKRHAFSLALLFLFILFFFFSNSGLDPDFGWHMRLGEYVAAYGMPQNDPFSYSMSYYPFIDFEWVISIAMAFLYRSIGLDGLALVSATIAFLAFFLQTISLKRRYLIFPLSLSMLAATEYLGIRPQVFSWLFVSVLLLLFMHKKLWQKFRFVLPLIMLLWVNIHGSFPLGVMLLGFFVLMSQLKSKRLLLADWVILLLTIAATFITPFGWRSWHEVWMVVSEPSLRWSIQEWLPVFFFLNVGFVFLFPVSVSLVLYTRKKFTRVELFLYFFLLCFGLSSARHLPFWLLIAIPMTTRAIEYFMLSIQKIPFAKKRFKVAAIIFISVFFLTFLTDHAFRLNFTTSRFATYPESAVAFLKSHPSSGNLFSHYNWGGYLLWQYPEKKVFVDGRMPTWREANPPPGQSKNAFKEYEQIMNGDTNPKEFFVTYQIDTVMIGTHDGPNFPVWLEKEIEKLMGVKFPNQKSLKEQLKKVGMREIYKDERVVIYRFATIQ